MKKREEKLRHVAKKKNQNQKNNKTVRYQLIFFLSMSLSVSHISLVNYIKVWSLFIHILLITLIFYSEYLNVPRSLAIIKSIEQCNSALKCVSVCVCLTSAKMIQLKNKDEYIYSARGNGWRWSPNQSYVYMYMTLCKCDDIKVDRTSSVLVLKFVI